MFDVELALAIVRNDIQLLEAIVADLKTVSIEMPYTQRLIDGRKEALQMLTIKDGVQ